MLSHHIKRGGNEMIVLASGSPRRKELLGLIEPNFTIITSDADETPTKTVPSQIVEELSLRKAMDVYGKIKNHYKREPLLIIAADTLVFKGNIRMGKPSDKEDALKMLKSLQGDVHEVYTGVTLIYAIDDNPQIVSFNEKTEVEFARMSDQEIETYVDTKEPMDKAGAYAIQGMFGKFITKVTGEYNNVVGLPIARLYQEMKKIGFYTT